jgi:hypothetical protein
MMGRVRNAFRGSRAIALVLVFVLVVVLGGGVVSLWRWLLPSGPNDTSRQLLTSIRDLNRFVAAEFEDVEIIDLQDDCGAWVPAFICGEHTVLLAVGSVEAYVDFDKLDQEAIKESQDRRAVEIVLPTPQFATPKLDHSRCQAYDLGKGVLTKLSGVLHEDPNKLNKLYELADRRVAVAARNSGVTQRAENNTRRTLEALLHALGYSTVRIAFRAT